MQRMRSLSLNWSARLDAVSRLKKRFKSVRCYPEKKSKLVIISSSQSCKLFNSLRPISERIFVAICTCMSILVFRLFRSENASMALVKVVAIASADVSVLLMCFCDSQFHWFSSLSTFGPASWNPRNAFSLRIQSLSKSSGYVFFTGALTSSEYSRVLFLTPKTS